MVIVRTDIIHRFASEFACMNQSRISHDTTKFCDHVSRTIPDVIMGMIDLEGLMLKP